MFELESAKNLDNFISLREKDDTKVRKLSSFSEANKVNEIIKEIHNDNKSIHQNKNKY